MSADAERYARLHAIFKEVRHLAEPARADILDKRCGDDASLRRGVEDLLASLETETPDALCETGIEAARGALEEVVAAGDSIGAEQRGDLIGRYRLVEPIGEGGMGSVWRAAQSEPVEREVALKVIRLGMDTREVVARFEAERQALAVMDHPNVAKVLDGGATRGGRPFFVMELVPGTPITICCDRERLGLRERLALFIKVCRALQHAHQKGLIHRDIKPSNVLVSSGDTGLEPKIIDFGIAKATSTSRTHETIVTQHSQVLGTPAYMAPEQADFTQLDIDTRADVYSLGVLLYELLTGTLPFDVQTALDGGFDELLRTIREDEPQRPSTRVSTHDRSADEVAANRSIDFEGLRRNLRGDLDWIVMKALEKDRARRYGSANALADEIERYLNHETVEAVPPSLSYRFHKLVRRRKKAVVAVSAITLVFLVGSFGTAVGLWKSLKANRALDLSLDEEKRQRKRAEQNEERALDAEASAERRAAELAQVSRFESARLLDLDVPLMGIRLRRSLIDAAREEQHEALEAALSGINFTNIALDSLKENLLDRTTEAIDDEFAEQPVVRARLLQTMALTLRRLGLTQHAEDPQARALAIRRKELGPDHEDTAYSINMASQLLFEQNKLAEAETLHREAIEASRRAFGVDDAETLSAVHNLGSLMLAMGDTEQAERYYTKALEGRRRALGVDHADLLFSLSGMGSLRDAQGRWEEAVEYLRQAVAGSRRIRGPEHRGTLVLVNNLGGALLQMGQLEEAADVLREAVEVSRRVHGDVHPSTLGAIGNFGVVLTLRGEHGEAERFSREALDGLRQVRGNEHDATLNAIHSLAMLSSRKGDSLEAVRMYREALAGRRKVLGEDHPRTLSSNQNLAVELYRLERHEEAELLIHEALGLMMQSPERHKSWIPDSWSFLATIQEAQGNFEGAEQSLRQMATYASRIHGDDHPESVNAVRAMGVALQRWKKTSEAEPFLREVLDTRKRTLGEEHEDTLTAAAELARLLTKLKRHEEALPLSRDVVRGRRKTLGDEHVDTLDAIFVLGIRLYNLGRYVEVEPLYREAYVGRRRVLGPDDPHTQRASDYLRGILRALVGQARSNGDESDLAGVLSRLGEHLVLRGEHEEAEPALRDARVLLLAAATDEARLRAVEEDLGAAIAAAGRFAEAEPLVVGAAEWSIAKRAETDGREPPNASVTATLQRAIDLYEAWHEHDPAEGHEEKATLWRAHLQALE